VKQVKIFGFFKILRYNHQNKYLKKEESKKKRYIVLNKKMIKN